MSKTSGDNAEVIEFTQKLTRLKIGEDVDAFFEEFRGIYAEILDRKQLFEEEVIVEEQRLLDLKKKIGATLDRTEMLKNEVLEAGKKMNEDAKKQKQEFDQRFPEAGKVLDKIRGEQKELNVLCFSKEFRDLIEQGNLMLDSRSFDEFRNVFGSLRTLPETSEHFFGGLQTSFDKRFEETRQNFISVLQKVLTDKYLEIRYPFDVAVDYQSIKKELVIIADVLYCLYELNNEDTDEILKLIFEEFRKRFTFHFYGDRRTNVESKPEFFFTQISAWISFNVMFMEGHLQPLFYQIGQEDVSVTEEFIEFLVGLAAEKVRILISKPTFADDFKLLSHLIDETVIFERELNEVYMYSEASPHVISELCREDILDKWITMEQNTISAGIDSILSDATAYENRFKDAVDLDEHLVPNFADAFIILMQAMAERYRSIPDERIQCRFLKLQIIIVDEFRSRMVQISHVMDTPLNHPNPQLLNAFWYVSDVLDEWSSMPEYIRLQSFMDSRGEKAVRGTFDDQSGLYRHVWRQKAKALTAYFSDLIAYKLKAYIGIKWFQVDVVKPCDITPQFLPFLKEVERLINWINDEISPISVMTFYHLTNHEIWKVLQEDVVSQINFHYRGAAQMLFDMTSGLIPLLESLYKWPKVTVSEGILNRECIELLNTLKILSLPSPTAVLLKEEIETNPEQVLEEKLQPFNISGLSKRKVLEIFNQRCDMNLLI